MKFAEYAKAYVALAVLLAQSALEVVPDERAQTFLRLVITLGGAFAVWKVPNIPSVTDEEIKEFLGH